MCRTGRTGRIGRSGRIGKTVRTGGTEGTENTGGTVGMRTVWRVYVPVPLLLRACRGEGQRLSY